jgi:alpha-N-arabinofuranosidase
VRIVRNKNVRLGLLGLSLWLGWGYPTTAAPGQPQLRVLRPSNDPSRATVWVRLNQRSPHRISPWLTGKFAEHLGWNIYNGMDAQILRNPTFADYPFWTGQMSPDGVTRFHADEDKITAELRRQAQRFGWPQAELDGLVQSYRDGLASFWTRVGERNAVEVSPDTGPHGGRAQRVQVRAAGQGVAQWTWLPLHRVRQYQFELMARSPDLEALTVTLSGPGPTMAKAEVTGLSGTWRKVTGKLELPDSAPAEAAYRFSITAPAAGQWVLRHVFLRPADHVNGADPDVVRLLKESRLPVLRWPGGNFVSGYHWQDGVGPVEQRPTRPNYAWGGVELNTFGTAEFIAFCRAVGAEPLICINAGSGTPAEAAAWVQYCNGSPDSPMGALRAAHGHPQPYRVRWWEVGNELWGRWQFYWTTAAGYVDRYKQFAAAMRAADPSIELLACGAPVFWGRDWNATLMAGLGSDLKVITDHPLIGGTVPADADPLAVYQDFMAVPEVLADRWAALEQDLRAAGGTAPRLAVTELQMFARVGQASQPDAPVRLTGKNLVGQPTLTEALYDVLVYHAAVRLAPFIELITHSATVNHGGGLRKERERVYAQPCYYAQADFAALAQATPVAVELHVAFEQAPRVLPDLRRATAQAQYSLVDALAAQAPDGSVWLSLVNRHVGQPVQVEVILDGFRAAGLAQVRQLSAPVPWAANTLEQPQAVKPVDFSRPWADGKLTLDLPPYTWARVRLPSR